LTPSRAERTLQRLVKLIRGPGGADPVERPLHG
jgi:hypothetical protein